MSSAYITTNSAKHTYSYIVDVSVYQRPSSEKEVDTVIPILE